MNLREGRLSRRRVLQFFAGSVAAATVSVTPAFARSAPLSDDDLRVLDGGGVVRRPVDFELEDGDYFGGVAYAVIRASQADVMATLADPAAYRSILPLTLEARDLGRRGELAYIYLKQGGRLGTASYTLVLRRESTSSLRFWLDPTRPHEIADCWGSFRVQPFSKGRTLLTFGVVVRLDYGPMKLLFADKIRSYALEIPNLVRRHVEGRPPSR